MTHPADTCCQQGQENIQPVHLGARAATRHGTEDGRKRDKPHREWRGESAAWPWMSARQTSRDHGRYIRALKEQRRLRGHPSAHFGCEGKSSIVGGGDGDSGVLLIADQLTLIRAGVPFTQEVLPDGLQLRQLQPDLLQVVGAPVPDLAQGERVQVPEGDTDQFPGRTQDRVGASAGQDTGWDPSGRIAWRPALLTHRPRGRPWATAWTQTRARCVAGQVTSLPFLVSDSSSKGWDTLVTFPRSGVTRAATTTRTQGRRPALACDCRAGEPEPEPEPSGPAEGWPGGPSRA